MESGQHKWQFLYPFSFCEYRDPFMEWFEMFDDDERNEADDEHYRETCLHGMGFEVFGEVYEEWEVEQVEEISQDRVQRLDTENKALPVLLIDEHQAQIKDLTGQNEKLQAHNQTLLSEVESLKARIRQLENKRSAAVACLLEDG